MVKAKAAEPATGKREAALAGEPMAALETPHVAPQG
jgi:hypothetical protein